MYQLQAPLHCSVVTPQPRLASPCCQPLLLDATCSCPKAGLTHIHTTPPRDPLRPGARLNHHFFSPPRDPLFPRQAPVHTHPQSLCYRADHDTPLPFSHLSQAPAVPYTATGLSPKLPSLPDVPSIPQELPESQGRATLPGNYQLCKKQVQEVPQPCTPWRCAERPAAAQMSSELNKGISRSC